jgi:hypothetical protein
VQTEVRAAQNSSNIKAHWSSAQTPGPSSPLGRGSLVLATCAFQLAFPQALAPRETNTQRFSDFSATINSPELLLPLASAVASHSPSLSGAARPPHKGTGPGAALPDTFIEPYLATWAQLAALSFLNHCASISIEIPSSCDWIFRSFFRSASVHSGHLHPRSHRASLFGLHWGYHRSGARYFTAAKKRSSFIGGKSLSPKLRPFCLLPQAARCLLPLQFQKATSDPFVGKPVHSLSITKMISVVVPECLL